MNITKVFKSKLVKDTGLYSSINVIDKLIPFLILPILTRILPVNDVGYFVLYQSLFQFFIPILSLSLQNTVILNYFRLNIEEFKSDFTTNFIFFIIFFSISSFILIIFIDPLVELTEFSRLGFYLLVAIVFFQYINELRQSLWRNQRKVITYGIFTIIQTIFKYGIAFFLIFLYDASWYSIIIGHLFGYLILSIYSIYSFIQDGYFTKRVECFFSGIRDSFKISYPISLHRMAAWLGTTVNRVLISNRMGNNFTASFGIASTFNVICTVLFDSLNKAYVPELYSRLANFNASSEKGLKKLTFYYYLVICSVTLSIALLGYFTVGIVFGNDYVRTRDFIIPLTLSAGFVGLYKIHVNYIFYSKKTIYITLITGIAAAINIPSSIFLISMFGLSGAAYSLIIVNFIYYILAVYFSRKVKHIYEKY